MWEMYQKAQAKFRNGGIDWDTDTIKMALLAGHTPDLVNDEFWSDVSADEESGAGYTAGGETLTCSVTLTQANSWGTAHATSTAYVVGQIVRPSIGNGYLYRCVVAGTSGGSAPSWPTTPGTTVTDGTAVWLNIGQAILVMDADNVTWTNLDVGTPSHGVVYKDTGTPATSSLIAINDGITTASNGANYTVEIDPAGIIAEGVLQ